MTPSRCGACPPDGTCPQCHRTAEQRDRHAIARALYAELAASQGLTPASRTSPTQVEAAVLRSFGVSGDDVATLHESLFAAPEIADLSASIEDLETLLLRLRDDLEANTRKPLTGPNGVGLAPPPAFLRNGAAREPDQLWVAGAYCFGSLSAHHPRGVVWNAQTGALIFCAPDATAVALGARGDELFVAMARTLDRRAWPSLELIDRVDLAHHDGVADRVDVSPSGRTIVVMWQSLSYPGGGSYIFDLSPKGAVRVVGTFTHGNRPGPVAFGPDDEAVAYSCIDPNWPAMAAVELASPKPLHVDVGGLHLAVRGDVERPRLSTRGCSWALYD